METKHKINRREFVKVSALTAAGAVIAACGATPTATPVPPTPVPPTAVPPTATKAPAAPTAAPAAPTAAPAAPTATKAPVAAPTATAVPPTAVPAPVAAPLPSYPRKGGTLVRGSATMFQNLNPFNVPGGQWQFALRMTTVRLINLDAVNNYIPDLAQSWTISPDGKEYTFNLRNDVQWSNKVKVTAQDCATTFNLHCQKDTGSNSWSILKAIEGAQDVYDGKAKTATGIQIIDSYTFKLKVSITNPGFLLKMPDIVIVPHSVFGAMAPKDIISSDWVVKGPTLSSGPYLVKSFTPNEQIEFVANDLYYRGKPGLDTLIDKKIPDRNTRLLAFEKGEVDIIDDALSTDYDRIMKLPGISNVTYLGTIGAFWINYHSDAANPKDPKYVAMNTKEFRQALSHAWDREGWVNISTSGKPENYILRNCWWDKGIFGMGTCDPTLPQYKYDVAKAKALLKQINWDPNWEVRYRPYGLTVSPADEAMQQMWIAAGIKIKVEGTDPATFITEMYEKGDFDITSLGLGANGNMVDFFYRFRTGNIYNSKTCAACYNLIRYGNAEFDKLVEQANTTADPKVYEPLMKRMQEIFSTELPFIVQGQTKAYRLLGPKVDPKSVTSLGVGYSWENPNLWTTK